MKLNDRTDRIERISNLTKGLTKEITREITFPSEIVSFCKKYTKAFLKENLDPNKSFFFGGCIRDMILNRKVNDYDMTSGYSADITIKALKKHNIDCYNKDPDHIYIKLDNLPEIQISPLVDATPDFTLNGFFYSVVNLKISDCEDCWKDIEENRLKLVKKEDPRVFRRGIYMHHIFPFLNFDQDSIESMKKFNVNEDVTLNFIRKKKMTVREFYDICQKWGLENQVEFLKKYL